MHAHPPPSGTVCTHTPTCCSYVQYLYSWDLHMHTHPFTHYCNTRAQVRTLTPPKPGCPHSRSHSPPQYSLLGPSSPTCSDEEDLGHPRLPRALKDGDRVGVGMGGRRQRELRGRMSTTLILLPSRRIPSDFSGVGMSRGPVGARHGLATRLLTPLGLTLQWCFLSCCFLQVVGTRLRCRRMKVPVDCTYERAWGQRGVGQLRAGPQHWQGIPGLRRGSSCSVSG